MRSLRWIAVLVVMVVLSMSFMPAPSYADSGDFIDLHKMLPGTSTVNKADNSDYYVLDQKKGFMGLPDIGEFCGNNMLALQKLVVKAVIGLIIMSYKLDVYSALSSQITTLMMPLRQTIFENFFVVGIALFIFSIIAGSVAMKTNKALITFFKGALIIAFAIWFMTYPAQTLDLGKSLMQAVNNDLIKNSAAQTGGGSVSTDEAMVRLSNAYWERYVEMPWIYYEFGGDKAAQSKYMPQLLTLKPGSDERQMLVETMREENPVNSGPWGIVLFFIVLLQILIFIPVIALCAVNIGSSVFVLLVTVFAAVIFVLSLVPIFGERLFVNWLFTLISFLGITVMVTIGLTVVLRVSDACYSIGGQYGLGVTFLLMAIIMVMLFLWRKKLINIGSAMRYGGNGVNKAIEHNVNPLDQARQDSKNLKSKFRNTKEGITEGTRRAYDTGAKVGGKIKAYSEAHEFDSASSDAALAEGVNFRGYDDEMNYRKAAEETEPEINYNLDQDGHHQMDYRETVKASGEYLWAKYNQDQKKSQKDADDFESLHGYKIEPIKSDFVKRVDQNRADGKDPFDGDDVSNTVGMFNRMKKEGRTVDSVYRELYGMEPLKPKAGPESVLDENDEQKNTGEFWTKDIYGSHGQDGSEKSSEQSSSEGRCFENDYKKHQEKEQKVVVEGEYTSREIAEIFMKKQFDIHVKSAHDKAMAEAARTGKDTKPNYDEFTEKVKGRMSSGKPSFSKAEIDRAEKFIETLAKGGKDPGEFIGSMDKAVDMSHYMNLKKEIVANVSDIEKSSPAEKQKELQDLLKAENHQNMELDDVKKMLEDMKTDIEEVKEITSLDPNEKMAINKPIRRKSTATEGDGHEQE